jgi:hypothetical protein
MRRQRLLCFVALVFAATVSSAGAGGTQGPSAAAPGQHAPEGSTLPSIAGTTVEGQVLTASAGSWNGPVQNYSFQWARCNSSGAACSAVAGATNQTQLLGANDRGATLRVIVTASNKNGASVATSDPTSVITAATSTTSTSTTTWASTTTTTTAAATTTTTPTTSTTTSTATTTTPQVDSPFFSENFDAGLAGISSLWRSTPDRTTNPSQFINEPGNPDGAVGLFTKAGSYQPNTGQMSSLWLTSFNSLSGWDQESNKAVNGQGSWYHQQFKLPSGAYLPTPSEWNWLVVWHDDDHTSSYGACCSTAIGVFNDSFLTNALIFRLAGGDSSNPTYDYSCKLPANSLQYDHWYDSVEHIYWSTSSTVGRVEWWLDGVQICSKSFPTLFSNPDGTISYNTFGIYNYHAYSSSDSRVDYDNVSIGSSRASVGA